MGGSESKPRVKSPAESAASGMENAMKQCNSALQYLNTSVQMLTTKRNTARSAAVAAYNRNDTAEAVDLLRKADIAEADLQTIRRRQLAIERQRSMIEQQQLNTMLTTVLVETSAALHSANMGASVDGGSAAAERVQQATEQMEEVADCQAELADVHLEFDDVARRGVENAAAALQPDDSNDDAADGHVQELEQLALMSRREAQKKDIKQPKDDASPPPPADALTDVLPDAPTGGLPSAPPTESKSAVSVAAVLI